MVFKGGADTLDGADLAAARMRVSGATMTLEGTIATQGTVSVGPLQGSASTLLIGAGGATLTGGTWAINAGAQGLEASDTLTNASATISGSGDLGEGQMGLINRKAATIDGNTSGFLDIDTGTNRVSNSGLIEGSGKGGVVVSGALLNSGTLEANGGVLLVRGNVSGPGSGLIAGGELGFDAAFSENVAFTGNSGTLYLGQSQVYTGSISGFPLAGKALLDLGDIGFVSSTEATFSGTATSGVLTVTDEYPCREDHPDRRLSLRHLHRQQRRHWRDPRCRCDGRGDVDPPVRCGGGEHGGSARRGTIHTGEPWSVPSTDAGRPADDDGLTRRFAVAREDRDAGQPAWTRDRSPFAQFTLPRSHPAPIAIRNRPGRSIGRLRGRATEPSDGSQADLRHPPVPAAPGGIPPLPGEDLGEPMADQRRALSRRAGGRAGQLPGRWSSGPLHQRHHRPSDRPSGAPRQG